MIWVIVALYVAAAVLPLLGLGRLYRLALFEARRMKAAVRPTEGSGVSIGMFDTALPMVVGGLTSRPRAVVLDFVFIGTGLVLGAAASIWSLFV